MAELVLRKLNDNDEETFLNALHQWQFNSGFTWVRDYQMGMPFSEYIKLLTDFENGKKLPAGYVAGTSLFGFVNSEIVGRVSLRHELSDFLLNFGGHIGYGVLPKFRKKGYAKKMLALTLPFANRVGIKKALVTCDDNNIGSIKTIEANGGILENIVFVDENKPKLRRYWINLETPLKSKSSQIK
jgi:predicted acetyltransferase